MDLRVGNDVKVAKILAFPERGKPRPELRLVCTPIGPEDLAWPELPLDADAPPAHPTTTWLEQALVVSLTRSLHFLKILCGLPPACISSELKHGPLHQLEAHQQSLLLSLELLRLGSLGDTEVAALVPGLLRAWVSMKQQREQLLLALDPRDLTVLLAEERSTPVRPLDVEEALRIRSAQRVFRSPPEQTATWMVLPGGGLYEQPGQAMLDQKACRQRRLEQDFSALPNSLDVASCLETLPRPWLEGIARGLALPGIDDRWEQERRVREYLLSPRTQQTILHRFSAISRRILVEMLCLGGNLRYDRLLLHYGADEEAAWHWAEEVPTTPVESLRRSGLVYVGLGRVGRKSLRLAIIPEDLQESLKRQLARLVAL